LIVLQLESNTATECDLSFTEHDETASDEGSEGYCIKSGGCVPQGRDTHSINR